MSPCCPLDTFTSHLLNSYSHHSIAPFQPLITPTQIMPNHRYAYIYGNRIVYSPFFSTSLSKEVALSSELNHCEFFFSTVSDPSLFVVWRSSSRASVNNCSCSLRQAFVSQIDLVANVQTLSQSRIEVLLLFFLFMNLPTHACTHARTHTFTRLNQPDRATQPDRVNQKCG